MGAKTICEDLVRGLYAGLMELRSASQRFKASRLYKRMVETEGNVSPDDERKFDKFIESVHQRIESAAAKYSSNVDLGWISVYDYIKYSDGKVYVEVVDMERVTDLVEQYSSHLGVSVPENLEYEVYVEHDEEQLMKGMRYALTGLMKDYESLKTTGFYKDIKRKGYADFYETDKWNSEVDLSMIALAVNDAKRFRVDELDAIEYAVSLMPMVRYNYKENKGHFDRRSPGKRTFESALREYAKYIGSKAPKGQ